MKKPWFILIAFIGAVGVILYFIYQKTKKATAKLNNLTSSPLITAAGTLLTQAPGVTSNEISAGVSVFNAIVGLFQKFPSVTPAVDNFGISQAGTDVVYNDSYGEPSGVASNDYGYSADSAWYDENYG